MEIKDLGAAEGSKTISALAAVLLLAMAKLPAVV